MTSPDKTHSRHNGCGFTRRGGARYVARQAGIGRVEYDTIGNFYAFVGLRVVYIDSVRIYLDINPTPHSSYHTSCIIHGILRLSRMKELS